MDVLERNASPSSTLEALPGLFKGDEDDFCHEFYFSEMSHSLTVLQGLNNQRLGGVLCDVTICVGQEQFKCHRNVLAACSPYFMAMFTDDLKEKSASSVLIEGIEPEVMSQLIAYAYTSDITINQNNAQHLLSAANMVQITSIREACCRFLEKEMDSSNCLGIHCFAEAHVCIALAHLSKNFALENFSEVAKFDEILLLPKYKLIEFLESNALNVEHEEISLQVVIDWVHHDPDGREELLGEVLRYVRLPLVRPYIICDLMDSEPMLTRNKDCRKLLDEAMKFLIMKDRQMELQNNRSRARTVQKRQQMLVTVGGEIYNKNYLNSVDGYDVEEGRWVRLKELPFPRCHHGTVISDNKYIYVAGGFNKDKHVLNNVLRYEPMLDKWVKVANMKTPRSRHGMASLDGFIYVVGGYDGMTRIDSVERYDPELNIWTNMAPMVVALSRCQAVSYRGHLYVAGGTTEPNNQCSDTLQRYNPLTNCWDWLTPMPVARWLFGLVVARGQLYAVGGTEDTVRASKKVFSYNIMTNKWTELAPMIEPRCDAGVAVIHDRLFVLSGHDGENSFYHSMEEYSFDKNTWTVLSSTTLPYGRCRFGCVAISKPIT